MKKTSIVLTFIAILAVVGLVYADDPDSLSGYNYCPYCGGYLGSQGGYGMGPGMIGGYGSGYGMMGVYGMGRGMMGRGYQSQSPECQSFSFWADAAGLGFSDRKKILPMVLESISKTKSLTNETYV